MSNLLQPFTLPNLQLKNKMYVKIFSILDYQDRNSRNTILTRHRQVLQNLLTQTVANRPRSCDRNCSIAIKNEIYSSSLFMIMTIFYVFRLTFKKNNRVNPLTVGSAISHRTFMENK